MKIEKVNDNPVSYTHLDVYKRQDDNIKAGTDAIDRAKSLTNISNETKAYLVRNNMNPTVSNVYKATYSSSQVQDYRQKTKMTEISDELFEELKKDYISGVTLSGGDPLHPENREDIALLIDEIRSEYPEKTIWLYTGFDWEEICDLPCIAKVDVVVDLSLIHI